MLGFKRKLLEFAARALAFNGKLGAAVFFGRATRFLKYGKQSKRLGNSAIFVLPSTPGAARGFWTIAPWRELGHTSDQKQGQMSRRGGRQALECERRSCTIVL